MKRKTKQVGTAVRKPAARTVSQTCAHLNALPTRRPIRSCVNTTFVLKATCSMRQICGDLGQVTYTAAAYTYGSPTADSMVDRGGPLPLRGAPSPICTQLRGVTQTTGTQDRGHTDDRALHLQLLTSPAAIASFISSSSSRTVWHATTGSRRLSFSNLRERMIRTRIGPSPRKTTKHPDTCHQLTCSRPCQVRRDEGSPKPTSREASDAPSRRPASTAPWALSESFAPS